MKRKTHKRKEKKLKRKKNQIGNILKGNKIKWKKLVAGVLGAALLYLFHGATVENTLFEDGDDANIFCAFNSPTTFLHLKTKIVINPLLSTG